MHFIYARVSYTELAAGSCSGNTSKHGCPYHCNHKVLYNQIALARGRLQSCTQHLKRALCSSLQTHTYKLFSAEPCQAVACPLCYTTYYGQAVWTALCWPVKSASQHTTQLYKPSPQLVGSTCTSSSDIQQHPSATANTSWRHAALAQEMRLLYHSRFSLRCCSPFATIRLLPHRPS